MEYKPTFVELDDVPMRQNQANRVWKDRLDQLPDNKAGMLKYNNRQRAHQVRNILRRSSHYWKIPLFTRVIHAEPVIHGTDGWLVYFWKRIEEK